MLPVSLTPDFDPEEKPVSTKVAAAEVASELERILDSSAFRRSPRLRALLEYAVTKALSFANVTERMVADGQFGRHNNFDPAIDPTVRVQYGRLRKRLKAYFQGEGTVDPVRIRIPDRTYTPIFEPNGQEQNAIGSKENNGDCWRPELIKPGGCSLAVLPFVNLTNDPTKDVYCFGLTDELIGELATIPNVDVVARSSSFQFQNSPVDIRTVGRELGVEMVLEGTVKAAGVSARVTAQLATVKDGFALWSSSYDTKSDPDNALHSQREIARWIVGSLPIPEQS